MAAELASGYISLTVKLAKGGMADVTKEITKESKKAGKDSGEVYSEEFNKKVEKDVGKKLPDAVNKSTKSGGGWKNAAKEAAKEFGKGVLEGVEQEVRGGGVRTGGLGKVINDSVTDSIRKTGSKAGGKDSAAGVIVGGIIDGITQELSRSDVAGKLDSAFGGILGDVDISGPVNGIIGSLAPLKNTLQAFKDQDLAGGLNGTVNALRSLEGVGVPKELADTLTKLQSPLEKIGSDSKATQIQGVADALIAMAPAIEDMTGADLSGVTGGLQKVSDVAGGVADAAVGLAAVETAVLALGGPSVIAALGGFAAAAAPLLAVAAAVAALTAAGIWGNKKIDENLGKNAPFLPNSPVIPPTAPNAGAPVPGMVPRDKREAVSPGEVYMYGPGITVPKSVPLPPKDKRLPGKAAGGAIRGPGGPKSDIIPFWASNGEHVLTAADVAKMGGQKGVYAFRSMLQGFSGGGAVGESAREFAHRVMQPYWQNQGFTVGDHGADKFGEHQNGALDIMVSSIAAGNAVLAQVLQDPNVYGAIFNNQTYGYGHGLSPRNYSGGHTGDPSQDHLNHVHVWYKPGKSGDIVPVGAAAAATSSSSGTSSSSSDAPANNGQPDWAQLADIGAGGLKETFLPPGFSDPTQWKSTKSVAGLLNFIGGIAGGMPNGQGAVTKSVLSAVSSGITGSGSGLYNGIMGAIPQPYGTLAPQPAPAGAPVGPGPGNNGTAINIQNFNEPVKGLMDKAKLQSSADQNKHLGARRFV